MNVDLSWNGDSPPQSKQVRGGSLYGGMSTPAESYAPAAHYDRVTDAWGLLLGDELHYGVFEDPDEPLATATHRLTELMLEHSEIEAGHRVLDVGCGTGAPARTIAATTGAHVTGITTSTEGVRRATDAARREGLSAATEFLERDGTANGLATESFDRVWVLESSHLMRRRDRLISECARVLRPAGRMALCDIILRRPMPLSEVKRLREPLKLLREVFGDARMETMERYRDLAVQNGLSIVAEVDLTAATRPTFAHWRRNAERNQDEVVSSLGAEAWRKFVDSCDVLEQFWVDGTLGYGLLAAAKPAP